jgi:Uncharacterized enzyme of heme biosynthesis
MKLLFRLLLIVAVAIALGVFARLNNGYVQLSAPMFRFESSLNFFVIAWLISLALFYYLARVVRGVTHLPQWWRTRRVRKAREKMFKLQNELFFSLERERFHDTQVKAKELLALPEAFPLPAVIGAEAALKMRDIPAAEEFIHNQALAPSVYRVTRTLLEAELCLAKNEPRRALNLLHEMREWEGLHSDALKLELRALMNTGWYRAMPPIIEQLESIRALNATEAQFMKDAVEAHLRAQEDENDEKSIHSEEINEETPAQHHDNEFGTTEEQNQTVAETDSVQGEQDGDALESSAEEKRII